MSVMLNIQYGNPSSAPAVQIPLVNCRAIVSYQPPTVPTITVYHENIYYADMSHAPQICKVPIVNPEAHMCEYIILYV